VTEPGSKPLYVSVSEPPSTRSNSLMPVGKRRIGARLVMISVMGVAAGEPTPGLVSTNPDPRCGSADADLSNCDSSSESHWLQSGHLPIHRWWVEPQDVQTKMVRVLLMG
jgi:hypothetical protein